MRVTAAVLGLAFSTLLVSGAVAGPAGSGLTLTEAVARERIAKAAGDHRVVRPQAAAEAVEAPVAERPADARSAD